MRRRVVVTAAVGAILVGAVIAAAMVALTSRPDRGIFLSTEGVPVVGSDFRIVLTVRYPFPPSPSLAYLSLHISGFELTPNEAEDNPWGLPNVWNLTGLDLSAGRTFALYTIPAWGAEYHLAAFAWRVPGNLSTVEFASPGEVDLYSVATFLTGYFRLTITWPFDLRPTAEGSFVFGGELRITTTIRGSLSGAVRVPSLLYLSLETSSVYYRILSSDGGDDPWGMPNVWNLTGLDLSQGAQFTLVVSPQLRGDRIPLEARAWSPRGPCSGVQFNQTGEIQNLDSVFLWASLTVDFAIA